ncbi:MAG: septum formation initiator family protein [Candidatus Gracilibacteria bacterium]|jgi:cell division protein DivIC
MAAVFSNSTGITKFIIIVEFFLVAYLLYSLTKNVYNSYQVDKYIETFESENSQLETENKQKMQDYLYFTSEEYIDKIAKQNLGLINPGEEIIVVAADLNPSKNIDDELEDGDFATKPEPSNPQKWVEFFFGK